MKKLILSIFCACFALSTSLAFSAKGGPAGTVEILHMPDDQAIIIRVSVNAVEAHLEHGDCVIRDSGEPEPERKPDPDDWKYCGDDDDES
jgi:hypothetical protein